MSLPQTTAIPPILRAPAAPPEPVLPAHPPPGPGKFGAGAGHQHQQPSKRLSPILQQGENHPPPAYPPLQSRSSFFNSSLPQQSFPSQSSVHMMQADQEKQQQQKPFHSNISAYPPQPTLSFSDENSSASSSSSLPQSSSHTTPNTSPNTSPTTSRESGRRCRRQSFAVPPVTSTDKDLRHTTRAMADSRPSSRSREPGMRASERNRQPSTRSRKLSSASFGSSGSDNEDWNYISEDLYSEPEDNQKHRHDQIRRRHGRRESRSKVDQHNDDRERATKNFFSVLSRSLSRTARSKSCHRAGSRTENYHDRSSSFSAGTSTPRNYVSTSSASPKRQYYDYARSPSGHAAAAKPALRSRQNRSRRQEQGHKRDSRAGQRGRDKNAGPGRPGATNGTSSKITRSRVKSAIVILGTVAAASMAARALMKNGQNAASGKRERGRKREHTRRYRPCDDVDDGDQRTLRFRTTHARPGSMSAHKGSRHRRRLSSTTGRHRDSSSSSSGSDRIATSDSSAGEQGDIRCSTRRRERDKGHAARGGPVSLPVLASPALPRAQSAAAMRGRAPVKAMDAPAFAQRLDHL